MIFAEFRKMDLSEIREIYYGDMVRQFPDSERRSFGNIKDLTARGLYAGYGLYFEGEIRAYALIASIPGSGFYLLDYLAVPDPWKNRGYGSEILNRIRSVLAITDRVLIETEEPDVLQGQERDIASKRLGFYRKNGFRETSIELDLFSVRYRLYVNEKAEDSDDAIMYALEALYRAMIPPQLYAPNVSMKLREED